MVGQKRVRVTNTEIVEVTRATFIKEITIHMIPAKIVSGVQYLAAV